MKQRLWIHRTFACNTAPDLFPGIVERVRGTPHRLVERTAGLTIDELTRRLGRKWSIQEQVGHLLDLEPLWADRTRAILVETPRLPAADTTNRRTVLAAHNTHPFADIISALGRARASLVQLFETATDDEIVRSSWHPRLEQPMSLVDLAIVVAEHDDHHLATITTRRAALGDPAARSWAGPAAVLR
jgi:uncharacterized damage-inducible protein DinB